MQALFAYNNLLCAQQETTYSLKVCTSEVTETSSFPYCIDFTSQKNELVVLHFCYILFASPDILRTLSELQNCTICQ